jgi:hypothetical protein
MSRWVRRILICIGAFFAIWAVSLPLIIGLADSEVAKSHQGDPPAVTMPPDPIQFGTGGSSCNLEQVKTIFSTRDQIRLVGPDPQGLREITIEVFEGSTYAAGYPTVRELDANAPCISDTIGSLPVGYFNVVIREGSGPAAQAMVSRTLFVDR